MRLSDREYKRGKRLKNYNNYTDEELIELIRVGEDDVIDYIMEKYKALVRKKANAMYLIGGETDDLIQEGMIGLFKAVRDYQREKDTSFYHFAQVCINRQIYTALEASNRKKHMPLNTYVSLYTQQKEDGVSLEELLISQSQESPEQQIIEQEVWKEFKVRLFKKLSKMEQQVLKLYLEGDSYTEIAYRLEKTPKSIDNALQRIRSKIEKLEGR